MKTKKLTKTVRVLFSVEVEVPLDNPNTMEEGPGPYLHGWLDAMVNETLCDIPGHADEDVPWRDNVGDFELFAVEESDPTVAKGAWRRVGWDAGALKVK